MRIKVNVSGLVAIGLCQKLPKSIGGPIIFSKYYQFCFYRFFIFSWNIIDLLSSYVSGFVEKKINPIKNYMEWLVDIPKGFIKDDPKKMLVIFDFLKKLSKKTKSVGHLQS